MLVGEGGDHRGVFFTEDIGAVEAAAEADLDDLHLGILRRERGEGERGEQLEGADVSGLGSEIGFGVSAQLGCERGEELLVQRLAVDPDALAERVQVGAGEQAGAQSGGAQAGFDHRGGGAFALGAGDMDGGASVLRVAHAAQERADAVEGEHGAGAAGQRAALEVREAHQPVDRGVVGGELGRRWLGVAHLAVLRGCGLQSHRTRCRGAAQPRGGAARRRV